MKIAAQLYTVRDLTAKDFTAAVRDVAAIGFAGVELAGYGSLKTAANVRKACDDAGLQVTSGHVGIDLLEADAGKVMDDFDTLGSRVIVVPWLAESRRNDYRKLAADLTAIAAKLASRGFSLAYHNHSFEFATYDGEYGLDILWSSTDPTRVQCELDLFWVQHGGVDPVAYMKHVAPRLAMIHLKDMDRSDRDKFAPVGTGRLDFASLLKTASELNLPWGIVEQDNCYDVPPLEALKTSFANLKKLGAV